MENQNNDKLNKILELTEENNEILKRMRKAQKIQNIFRTIYWIILIGAALGAYYFLQPAISSVMTDYKTIKSGLDSFSNGTSTNFFDQIKNTINSIR